MSGGVKITITGDKEVDAILASLSDKIAKQTLNRGIKAGARFLLFRAQSRMPKDTGIAVNNMLVKTRRKKRRRGTVAMNVQFRTDPIVRNSQTETATAEGTKVSEGGFYPSVIEYGSIKRNRPMLAPLRRTYESDGSTAQAIVTDAIRQDVMRLLNGVKVVRRRKAKVTP